MRRSGFAAVVLFALATSPIGTAGQAVQNSQSRDGQPAVTFKSEVGVVEINAVVTDAAGNFVRDLSRDDFQLYEDGRARPFSLFSLVDMPVASPVPLTSPEPDVRTLAESQNGRVYVIVLDDLHSAPLRTQVMKAAARRFVEKYLYPGDLAAIVYTGPPQAAGQELTDNRHLLLAAIDRFQGQQIQSAADGRLETYRLQQQQTAAGDQTDQGNRLDDPNDAERSFNARRTLATLRDAANWMGSIQGRRKSLIFFSEGIDYDMTDVFNSPGATGLLFDARDTIGSATRSNVSIYSVDPRGLSGLSDEFIDLAEPQNDTRTQREQLGTRGIESDLRIAQNNLRMLSEQTGGLSLVNSNDFAGGFERIVRDNSSYYVLGYYTQPDAKGGKFHKIDVRLRRPGLQVRARRGFIAADTKSKASKSAPSVLMEALGSPIPAGNLPMSVFAASFKGQGKNASVLITAEVAGGSFRFQEHDATFLDDIEFSLIAAGLQGKVEETDTGKVALAVKPDVRERIAQSGVRFLSRISLPPGRYQLRVAAREAGGGAASVVHYDLEVPDFSKEQLAMSGLVLTASSAGQMATPRGDAVLRAILPTPPTAARTFASGEVIDVYAEIYDNILQVAHGFDITTTVQAANGSTAFSSHAQHSSEASTTGQTFPYSVEVPLKGLAAGSYLLRVEVRSRLGNAAVVFHEVPFAIR
jgi:VWFA-related protein